MRNIVQDEKKDLMNEGVSSRFSMPDGFSGLNITALMFMSNLPVKYQALIAAYSLRQREEEVQKIQGHKKHEERFLDLVSEFTSAAQREIDRNKLTLSIDGENIEISQGELRKRMKSRLEALEERKEQLEQSGQNPEELDRINHLIHAYKPVLDKLKTGKADADTMASVQDLIKEDPELASEIKSHGHKSSPVADAGSSKRTSFSSQYFDTGAVSAPSLKDSFAKGASPDTPQQPQPSTVPPEPEKRQQTVSNNLQSMGF